ncbi:hypothetical protein AKJ50_02065 [candidate division MSBL1 archaeon SCGC-AAA382A13]|uniref:Uncharacterized protein n=1 Tax=candidate division MSBL1 archaeon SCGC-AAA382A13 TaxID=1698279 RepID=A0A133VE45_9EURY|nr:hypothetical protein AKJ50_02065 [candidate division MSBL1 archaeon SCGC-AAA382A13]
MGTLNELTIPYGEKKVIGLLKGVTGSSNEFENLANKIGRPGRIIVLSEKPEELVEKVLQKLKETK